MVTAVKVRANRLTAALEYRLDTLGRSLPAIFDGRLELTVGPRFPALASRQRQPSISQLSTHDWQEFYGCSHIKRLVENEDYSCADTCPGGDYRDARPSDCASIFGLASAVFRCAGGFAIPCFPLRYISPQLRASCDNGPSGMMMFKICEKIFEMVSVFFDLLATCMMASLSFHSGARLPSHAQPYGAPKSAREQPALTHAGYL